MTWARPTGIGLLVVAALFGIGVRVEIGHETTNWAITAVYIVLGVIAAVAGAGLMIMAQRTSR
ncbi:hypothetical protein ACQP00_35845 [Dactylosporangium sp. CS-047395]|uniref:hypothetical protein n=1 Tax=Dactylosporangium sp. CS-047395 TaxID=3239936 RepID=UPI003D90A6D6